MMTPRRRADPRRRRPALRAKELTHVRTDVRFDYCLSPLRSSKRGNDAGGRVPVFLSMPRLLGGHQTQARRLLRVLFVWRRALPADAGSAGEALAKLPL